MRDQPGRAPSRGREETEDHGLEGNAVKDVGSPSADRPPEARKEGEPAVSSTPPPRPVQRQDLDTGRADPVGHGTRAAGDGDPASPLPSRASERHPMREEVPVLGDEKENAARGAGPAGVVSQSRRSALLFVVQCGSAGLGLVLYWAVARWASLEQFGAWIWAAGWIRIASVGSTLGLDVTTLRFAREPGYRNWARRTTSFASLVAAGLLLALAPWTPTGDRLLLPAVALVVGVTVQLRLDQAFLLARGSVLLSRSLEGIARPVGTLALLALGALVSDRIPAAAVLGVQAIVTLGLVLAIRRRRSLGEAGEGRPDPGRWWTTSIPVGAVSLLRTTVGQLDILWVGWQMGLADAAVYGMASRLAAALSLATTATATTAAPRVGGETSVERLEEVSTVAARGATLLVGAGFLVFLVSGERLLALFGPELSRGTPVLWILALAQVLNAWVGPVGWILNLRGLERANALLSLGTLMASVVVLPSAISAFGLTGAATATAVLQGSRNLVAWGLVRRRLGFDPSAWGRVRWTREAEPAGEGSRDQRHDDPRDP